MSRAARILLCVAVLTILSYQVCAAFGLFETFGEFSQPIDLGREGAVAVFLFAISSTWLAVRRKKESRWNAHGQTEEALRASEERYARAVSAAVVGVWEWDLETDKIHVDPSMKDLVGFTDEEIDTHIDDWVSLLHADDRERLRQELDAHLRGLKPRYEFEHRIRRKDGSVRWLLARGLAVRDTTGRPYRMYGSSIDITEAKRQEEALRRAHEELEVCVEERTAALTEANASLKRQIADRRRAEEALRESEVRFRATFEQAAVGVAHVGADGRLLRVNQKLSDILGYSREELLTRTFHDLTHPDDLEADLEYVRQMLANTINTYSMETRYIRKDGSHIWVNLTVAFVRRSSGDPGYFISVVEDICDRKRAEEAIRESETRFRQLAEHIEEVFWLASSDRRVVYVSPAYEHVWGRPCQALYENPEDWLKAIHPDDRPRVAEKWLDSAVFEGPFEEEYRIVRPDGSIRWIRDRGFPIQDEAGGTSRIAGLAEDITERRCTEEERARLAAVLEETSDAVGMADATKKVLYVNRAGRKLVGIAEDADISDTSIADYHPPWAYEIIANEGIPTAIREGIWSGEHVAWLGSEGREVPISQVIIAHKDAHGNVEFMSTIARDIAERKRGEQALQESERRFRVFFESAPIGMAVVDADGRRTRINRAAEQMSGYSEEELKELSVFGVTHPDDVQPSLEVLKEFQEGKRDSAMLEKRYIRKDGSVAWGAVAMAAVRNDDGKLQYIIGMCQDITERKQAEEALRSMVEGTASATGEEFFRTAVRQLAAALQVRFAFVCELADAAVTRARTLAVWMGQGYADNFEYKLAGTPSENVVNGTICYYPEGVQELFPTDRRLADVGAQSYLAIPLFDSSGNPIGHMGIADDRPMTDEHRRTSVLRIFAARAAAEVERKRVERAARQHQAALAHVLRLSTMGELVAGLAHEINQPLAAIANYTGASLRRLRADPGRQSDVIEPMEKAAAAALRAGDVVSNLRDFVSRRKSPQELIDLNDIVQTAVRLMEAEVEQHGASLRLEMASAPLPVEVDRIQIEQVLLNLVINGLEAMAGSDANEKHICIQTVSQDGKAVVTVRDTGTGFAAATGDRMFDHFFSTKPKGLGMGLSISRSIVEAHEGRLWAVPNGDRGAAFQFTLPLRGDGA
jgi:PAS domain S-box-containing protein